MMKKSKKVLTVVILTIFVRLCFVSVNANADLIVEPRPITSNPPYLFILGGAILVIAVFAFIIIKKIRSNKNGN